MENSSYNDVTNQQDAPTFSFINFFKSATAFCIMYRHCCRQVYIEYILYIQPKKCSWGWANL